MESFPDVTIIGTGALGSALARAFSKKKIPVKSIYNSSQPKLKKVSKNVDVSFSGEFPASVQHLGKLIFITVPDDHIVTTAHKIAVLADSLAGYTMVHCSGNKSAEVLNKLSEKGAAVASFHPLQTFTSDAGPEIFEGIYMDIQGDKKAVALLADAAEKLGAKWFELSAEAKPYLHAAAVMASNYLIALINASASIAKLGGMDAPEIRQALLPLLKQSLDNAAADDLSDVLTGPIARGDLETVREHLLILEQNPSLLSLYKQLGKEALKLTDESPASGEFDGLFNS